MTSTTKIQVATTFLAKIGSDAPPHEVAALFSPGTRLVGGPFQTSCATRRMIERISFEVHDVLANNDRVVILGGLSTGTKAPKTLLTLLLPWS